MFVGTVGYAAPEQCLGQPVDARADIFSLGVVLFEMLAGARPFPGDDVTTVMRAMLQGDPPHIADAVSGVSPALDSLMTRALSRNQAHRPETVREFREGLRAIATDQRQAVADPAPAPTRRRGWVAVPILVVALGTAALVWSLASKGVEVVNPVMVSKPVVAVMPLTNATGDSSNDYVAVGIADNLITRLAGLPSITVLSRAAVIGARTRPGDLPALAAELGATYLIDGSVQQAGQRFRITLTLVRPDRSVAWADTAEGTFAGIFELQTRLASMLAQALAVQLSAADRASLAQQPTLDPDALAAYWRGRALLERRDVKGNTEASLAAFDDAIRRDPRFAIAHAARGEALWRSDMESRDPEIAKQALDEGLAALRLDPNQPQVRYSLALALAGSGRLAEATEELQRALVLQPTYDDARRQLGTVLAQQGRIDEAFAEFQKAIALRPTYAGHYTALGFALYQAGRYQEAADAFTKVVELQPDTATGYNNLGTAYRRLGRTDEALASSRKAIAITPSAQPVLEHRSHPPRARRLCGRRRGLREGDRTASELARDAAQSRGRLSPPGARGGGAGRVRAGDPPGRTRSGRQSPRPADAGSVGRLSREGGS